MFDIRRVFLYTDLMTKQNYIEIAKIINKYGDRDYMLLLKLCEYFKEDNPNFDADKFLDMVADDNIS